MTKKEMFTALIPVVENSTVENKEELIEGLNHEIELLNNKANSPRKPTAVQVENEALKAEIVTYLTAENSTKCIKELQEGIPALANLSNQRITHLLTALVNDETLIKEYVKKIPYYAIKN